MATQQARFLLASLLFVLAFYVQAEEIPKREEAKEDLLVDVRIVAYVPLQLGTRDGKKVSMTVCEPVFPPNMVTTTFQFFHAAELEESSVWRKIGRTIRIQIKGDKDVGYVESRVANTFSVITAMSAATEIILDPDKYDKQSAELKKKCEDALHAVSH